jgi:hypothetical protein
MSFAGIMIDFMSRSFSPKQHKYQKGIMRATSRNPTRYQEVRGIRNKGAWSVGINAEYGLWKKTM